MLTGSSDSFREDPCCFSGCSKPHFRVQGQISMSLLPLRLQGSRISVVLSPVFLHGCIEDANHKTILIFLIQWYCTFHLIPLSRTWIRGSKAPLVSLTRHKVGWECWPAWEEVGSAEGSGEAYYLFKFLDRDLEVPGILNILKSQSYGLLLKK